MAALGAKPVRILFDMDLATVKKPIINAGAIAAAISLGEFGATTLLSRSGQESMPIAIARLIGRTGDIPQAQAYVLCSILVMCTFLIVLAIEVRDA